MHYYTGGQANRFLWNPRYAQQYNNNNIISLWHTFLLLPYLRSRPEHNIIILYRRQSVIHQKKINKYTYTSSFITLSPDISHTLLLLLLWQVCFFLPHSSAAVTGENRVCYYSACFLITYGGKICSSIVSLYCTYM